MLLTSARQIQEYQQVCDLSVKIMLQLYLAVKVGVTSWDIETLANKLCLENQAQPSFIGVGKPGNLYPYATCISVNEVILHGMPNQIVFKDGDIIKVDFGLVKNGWYTDHCFTVGVGQVSPENQLLIQTGREAVLAGVGQARAGQRIGDIGWAIETTALAGGYQVIREYVGHGIGQSLHQSPEIPAWGKAGKGLKLKSGMVLCIEAQLVAGSPKLVMNAQDKWSLSTQDGSIGVMFEFMVLVEANQSRVLTSTEDWALIKT